MKRLLLLAALAVALAAQTGTLSVDCSACQTDHTIQYVAAGLDANKTYYVCPGSDNTCLPGSRGETSHTWTIYAPTPGSYTASLRTLKGRDWVIVASVPYQVN